MNPAVKTKTIPEPKPRPTPKSIYEEVYCIYYFAF
jgi:hypothetical protein